MGLKLRRQVPAAVRAVRLEERRLAWGVTDDGVVLVATPSALHVGDRALPWTQVVKVAWQEPVLTVREVAEVEDGGVAHQFSLAEQDRLAEVVRAQVTSSVAWSDVRRLEPVGKVRVVARRVPRQDALLWQLVWLEGTDPADEALRAQADALVIALRGTLG
ncbi:MAG: hypothetical protein M3P04_06485 [Actinomycetota bacterium]|nr:hypothetical protein [Actinomycetota bacterium]